MYIGFSKRLKSLSGIRIGAGYRIHGVMGIFILCGIGIANLIWYSILACMWMIYGMFWLMYQMCVWIFYKPVYYLVKAIKSKKIESH